MIATPLRIAAVTGANKGIGLAIVRQLALRYSDSALAAATTASSSDSNISSPGRSDTRGSFLIYLTSRDRERGEAALATLAADPALKHARVLASHGGPAEIRWHQLDITDKASIDGFTEHLRQNHGKSENGKDGDECLDIVVNNAGIAIDGGFDKAIVDATLHTNYWMTTYATRQFLPLMKNASTSRIVNLASATGRLELYTPELQARFRQARSGLAQGQEQASQRQGQSGEGQGQGQGQDQGGEAEATNGLSPTAAVDALMAEYAAAVGGGTHEAAGWPSRAYATSKSGLIAFTGALAREVGGRSSSSNNNNNNNNNNNDDDDEILINCCCPGWVSTDLTRGRGFKTPDQGAALPVRLALDDIGGATGQYWRDDRIVDW